MVNGLMAINYCPLGIYKHTPFAARASWYEQRCRPLGRILFPLFFFGLSFEFSPSSTRNEVRSMPIARYRGTEVEIVVVLRSPPSFLS